MATFQGTQLPTPFGLFKQSQNVAVFQSGQILGTQLTAVQRQQSQNVAVFQGSQSPIKSPSNPGVDPPTYRMRAFDTTLSRIVFWSSDTIDSLGANYIGPGPLVDIVIQILVGD